MMRYAIWAGLLALAALGGWGYWETNAPTPSAPTPSTQSSHPFERDGSGWASSTSDSHLFEPRELIDLSSVFEPIADEDRVPTLQELLPVVYLEPSRGVTWFHDVFTFAENAPVGNAGGSVLEIRGDEPNFPFPTPGGLPPIPTTLPPN